MKILLVGSATSVYLINFTIWLKKVRPEISVHVFSKEPIEEKINKYPYDKKRVLKPFSLFIH